MQPDHKAQRRLPWLLLLPVAILAWPGPGALLAQDPFPHLAGSGWVALASLPAALWLSFAGHAWPLPGLRPLLFLWACTSAAAWLGTPLDGFEAKRAWLQLSSFLVLYAAGAQLDNRGRRFFNRGLVICSLLWTARALIEGQAAGYAGVLGNSGTLSQAALPGAAIGAWYVVSRRGLYWFLGLFAFVLFLAHAGLAPVLAGGLALLGVLLVSCFISPWAKRKEQVRRRLGVLASLCAFALVAAGGVRLPSDSKAEPGVVQAEQDEADAFGGVGVRWRIWGTIPGLLVDRPLFGLGPGQFQAAYPPYRDALEIEASRGGVLETGHTLVNHAHNDALQGLAEYGLVAGLFWLLFLGLCLRAALRGLRQLDFPTIASAAAGLAILINGLFHSPLSMNPASAAMAAVLFGVTTGRHPDARGMQPTRRWRLALTLIALLGVPSAWRLCSQGLAFSAHIRANRAFIECNEGDGGPELNALYLRALAARRAAIAAAPESAAARFAAARAKDPEQELELWEAVLQVRPHSVEALEHLGALQVKADRHQAARAHWERALELSPTHPRLLENLARLEILEGDRSRGAQLLRQRLGLGPLQPELERYFGAQLILRGAWREGAPFLCGAEFQELHPTALNDRYQQLRKQGPEHEADALRALSQLLWAREYVEAGNLELARRSYGQALRPTRRLEPLGAPALRAEIGALGLLEGEFESARQELQGVSLTKAEREALPAWATQALESAGLLQQP